MRAHRALEAEHLQGVAELAEHRQVARDPAALAQVQQLHLRQVREGDDVTGQGPTAHRTQLPQLGLLSTQRRILN